MPAANCTDPVQFTYQKDPNPAGGTYVIVTVNLKWDGTSTPPNCDGAIQSIAWSNTGPNAWWAHFANAHNGPAVYRIDPGTSGTETRAQLFTLAGLSDRASIAAGFDVNRTPPQAGERQLN